VSGTAILPLCPLGAELRRLGTLDILLRVTLARDNTHREQLINLNMLCGWDEKARLPTNENTSSPLDVAHNRTLSGS
jgi:hypothetical protein